MADGNLITQVFLPLSLAFIMFSVGLELTVADFKRVATQPKDFAIGALSQVLLLPAVAFLLVTAMAVDPILAVGVMIIAACPGGVTSNIMTSLSKGDAALSVSLTAVISVLSVVTLPLIVGFSISHFLSAEEAPDLSVGQTIAGIFAITTVPVIIGMAVKRFAPGFAERFEKTARIIASVLFALIIVGAILKERDNVAAYFVEAGTITLALNLAMMALAIFLARLVGLGTRQRAAITLECGLQNGTLALFVAGTLIGSGEMQIPGAIYSLIMFPTAIAYMLYARRANAAA